LRDSFHRILAALPPQVRDAFGFAPDNQIVNQHGGAVGQARVRAYLVRGDRLRAISAVFLPFEGGINWEPPDDDGLAEGLLHRRYLRCGFRSG